MMTQPMRHEDPEVLEKPERRRFTTAFKLAVLNELDTMPKGQVGNYLRSKGLYSALVSKWRQQREEDTLSAVKPNKQGPKPSKDPVTEENERLRRRVAQLEYELETAELIIDVQKKVSQLLGIKLPTLKPSEKD